MRWWLAMGINAASMADGLVGRLLIATARTIRTMISYSFGISRLLHIRVGSLRVMVRSTEPNALGRIHVDIRLMAEDAAVGVSDR